MRIPWVGGRLLAFGNIGIILKKYVFTKILLNLKLVKTLSPMAIESLVFKKDTPKFYS